MLSSKMKYLQHVGIHSTSHSNHHNHPIPYFHMWCAPSNGHICLSQSFWPSFAARKRDRFKNPSTTFTSGERHFPLMTLALWVGEPNGRTDGLWWMINGDGNFWKMMTENFNFVAHVMIGRSSLDSCCPNPRWLHVFVPDTTSCLNVGHNPGTV